MERYDIDADHAFSLLRRYSQQNNIPLREIAAALVERRSLPDLIPLMDEVDVHPPVPKPRWRPSL